MRYRLPQFSRLQWLCLLAVVGLQACIGISIRASDLLTAPTPMRLAFVITLEALLLLVLLAVVRQRFINAAVVVYFLLAINFAITPWYARQKVNISLAPNVDLYVKIMGDVMPGFTDTSHVTTDAKGFRTTKRVNYDAKDSYRIFAIGGSTTEQIYLDDAKTWTALLERDLPQYLNRPVEVINAGVSGLRSEHHLAMLRQVSQYKPDMVIFMMGLNDWNSHIIQKLNPPPIEWDFTKSLLWKGLLALKPIQKPGELPNQGGKDSPRLEYGEYYSSQNNSLTRPDVREVRFDDVAPEYKALAGKIFEECKKQHYRCVFLTHPTAYSREVAPELKKRLWMTPPNQPFTVTLDSLIHVSGLYNDWLYAAAKESGFESCDLGSQIPPTTDYLYDDCHFNEGGAKRVAELLRACIGGSQMQVTIQ